jgi:hypothetical protein
MASNYFGTIFLFGLFLIILHGSCLRIQNYIMVMKKESVFVLILMFLLSANPFVSFGQMSDQIISGMKAGDAKIVASHFNENIELVVIDKELVCSKAQGEQILKDFFTHNKPLDFKITHQGGNDSSYAIGKMQTGNGNFRVYLTFKSKGGKSQIVQLRIEKD